MKMAIQMNVQNKAANSSAKTDGVQKNTAQKGNVTVATKDSDSSKSDFTGKLKDILNGKDDKKLAEAILQLAMIAHLPLASIQSILSNKDPVKQGQQLVKDLLSMFQNNKSQAGMLLKNQNFQHWLSQVAGILQKTVAQNVEKTVQSGNTFDQALLNLLSQLKTGNIKEQIGTQSITMKTGLNSLQLQSNVNDQKTFTQKEATTLLKGLLQDLQTGTSQTQLQHLKQTLEKVFTGTKTATLNKFASLNASGPPSALKANESNSKSIDASHTVQHIDASTKPDQQTKTVQQTTEQPHEKQGKSPWTMSLHSTRMVQTNDGLVAKPAQQSVPAQSFAENMARTMVKNLNFGSLSNGVSTASISLIPEHLGHVEVQIAMHNGQMVAHFAAQTVAGKHILESQLPQLRGMLQDQGIQVQKLEVTQNQPMAQQFMQDQRQQQSSGQFAQNQNRKQKSSQYDDVSFDFEPELEDISGMQRHVYGNSFDVTA